MRDFNLPRRSVLLGLFAAPLTVAACSTDKPSPAAPPASSSTSPTTTATPPRPHVSGAGLPADLLGVVNALYLGGSLPASAGVAAALSRRKVGTTAVTVKGAVGSWQSTPIAVVTLAQDVTLLVKNRSKWMVVGGWWPSLGLAKGAPAPAMRVLAIGSDARPNQRPEKCRGDALHIIGVDASGVGGIVGIPRDSYVPLSTGGTDKINAALVYGGADAMVATVSRATGVPLDGYILTGFKGFRSLVDGVGGIPYISKVALKSDGGTQLVRVGKNLLTGSTALGFARERHSLPNGDFGRSANQGAIIRAGMAVLKAMGPLALPKYLHVIGASVTTDLSPAQVLNLSAAAFRTSTNAVPNEVAQGSVGTRAGQSVVLLGGSARTLFADMRNGRLNA